MVMYLATITGTSLLIEPQGIEILKIKSVDKSLNLLIEPQGIEMPDR